MNRPNRGTANEYFPCLFLWINPTSAKLALVAAACGYAAVRTWREQHRYS